MISYQMFWWNVGRGEKITTYDLIKKHGISSNTLNRMKHGKPITTDTINKLCKALNCDVMDIISYEPDEETEPCQSLDNSGETS